MHSHAHLPKVLLLGPNINHSQHGGVISVVKTQLNSSLNLRYQLHWNHFDYRGSTFNKAVTFLKQLIAVSYDLLFNKYDLIHVHASLYKSQIPKFIFYALLRTIFGTKMIVQFHGGSDFFLNSFGGITSLCFRKFDTILVLAQHYRNKLTMLDHSLQHKIRIVPNFLEETHQNEVKRPGKTNVLLMARMVSDKGVFELLDAIKIIKDSGRDDLFFYFAGTGPALESIITIAKENEVEDFISFEGYAKGEEKQALLKKCSIFILPTKNDAFPLVILEAMSYGMAVISTDQGSISLMVDDQNGIILNNVDGKSIADAILDLSLDCDKLIALGLNSRKKFNNNFLMEPSGVNLLSEIYDNTLAI